MQNQASDPIHLSSVLDVLAAAPLCEELRTRLSSDELLELDGSAVERVSTACLQIILTASITARSQGAALRLTAPSPALSQAIADLGLDHSLFS
jgi:anti-anti-sigma regulatory factor